MKEQGHNHFRDYVNRLPDCEELQQLFYQLMLEMEEAAQAREMSTYEFIETPDGLELEQEIARIEARFRGGCI